MPEREPGDGDAVLGPRFRDADLRNRLAFILGVVISAGHVYMNLGAVVPTLVQNSLHFGGFVLLCSILVPLGGRREGLVGGLLFAANIAIGLVVAISSIWIVLQENAIYAAGVRLAPLDWVLGLIVIAGALEFTRRTTGWLIPILIVLALTYVAYWGQFVPGVFRFAGLSAETILFRSIFGDDGIFGTIARISSTFVFMFILFGAFLLRSGAGHFIVDLARAVAGRLTGGPGFVAVFASALTGTISGSAVANTASTGVITIPLMKRSGFTPRFAAAVEASASTGGQLMPPIMGAGAFVMSSYTQIPYPTIVAVSTLPAVLYFATVAFFVRIEAKRLHIAAADDADPPTIGSVLRAGGISFLIPIAVLIGCLMYGFTPTYAAGIGIISVVIASWLTPNRMGVTAVLEALALGARNMMMTAILLCSVGLVVNVIATAGIGNTFSLMIAEWSGSNLLVAIVLIAIASLVLGMGLPVTAAYIVLATLSAPALFALIGNDQIVTEIARGNVGEEAKAILTLAVPDQVDALGRAMSPEQAAGIAAAIPPDLHGIVRDALISPEALTFALLSAHLIIFWLSQDSNVTPPLFLTAFTAAAIARTPPMATGFTAWKVAKGLYIVPLLFAYTPLIGAGIGESLLICAFAFVGLYAFSAAFQGYMEAPLGIVGRLLALAGAAMCLWPAGIAVHGAGVALTATLLILSVIRDRRARR